IYDPSTVPGGRTVRFKDILAHVEERLRYNPLFTRRLLRLPLELDYPYWVDDEYFDLEYHVTHGRLPAPGDWRQFCIHMARYHSRPLDMNRPPWEMYVVEGLDHIPGLPAGSYAIATKVHHAAGDGTSLTRFFASLADADPEGTPAVPLEEPPEEDAKVPSALTLARRALGNNLRSPLRLAGGLLHAAPGLLRSAEESVRRRGAAADKDRVSVPPTRFNVPVSPHKAFAACFAPLDALRAVREQVPGATVNDVVLAICAGALRRYLEHHGELPRESLVAWVPVNARARDGDDGASAGNNISAMTTRIFTDEKDPVKRLRKVHRATVRSKAARAGVSARVMTDLTQHVPAATQVLASRLVLQSGVAARFCNLFISNVPGPQVPLYMNGARAVHSLGLAPLADGMGLFIATPSYNGEIGFNVISTREILPDIDVFMTCFEDSLAEYRALPTPGERPARRRAGKAAARKTRKAPAKRRSGSSRR
ncbi:MAG TPA: wax ester/triacylglycerol synthase family O-acyltransferase, partial [Pseudohaliea sp.]|nr:wax ester/triacylglycerol synthase family O-acyltransferase [Pseudohaliea sp.]